MKFSVIRWCVPVVLAGLILIGVHGHATPAPSPSNKVLSPSKNKVIIYPTVTEKIDQLAQKGITKVRSYGSYWLVEATDAQVDQLTQMYGARAVGANDLNRIRLTSLSFDTTAGDPVVPANLRQVDREGKYLRLVQLRGPVVPQWLHLIESSGARMISYVPNNAYLVFVDAAAEKRLEQARDSNGPIQWIGAYHPYYKIAPELRFLSGTEPIKVRVAIVDRSGEPQVESGVYAMGTVLASLNRSGQEIVEMEVLPSAIEGMARLADVLWIQKVEQHRLLDEVQDLLITSQTNGAGFGPISTNIGGVSSLFTNYLDFLTNTVGAGQAAITNQFAYPIVDVADTGLDYSSVAQPVFYEFGKRSNPTRVVYEEPPGYLDAGQPQLGCAALNDHFTGSEDYYNHGTPVASVIVGYDMQTNSSELCIYSTIVTQFFTDAISASSIIGCSIPPSGTGTGEFTFTTQPCSLITNLNVPCPTTSAPVSETLALPTEIIITQQVMNTHQDPSGFQFGLGVSPFGRIGISRVFGQAADIINGTTVQILPDGPFFCINSEESFIASAYYYGARIQNDSWSDALDTDGSNGGQYNDESQTFDTAVRDALLVGASNNVPGPSPLNQELIVVFAANSFLSDAGANGNVGGFGDIRLTAPSTAKNVITVGSAESVRLDGSGCAPANQEDDSFELYQYTAFGPTLDGRFKPEIVAPGTTIYGAVSELAFFDDPVAGIIPVLNEDSCGDLGQTNSNTSGSETNLYGCASFFAVFPANVTYVGAGLYRCDSGSSYAAPAVSGGIQLLWWYFQNRLTNELGHALLQPSPAMAKAYVCNAARYLPIINPQYGTLDTLPSNAQGMGELDLLRMFDSVPRAIRDESSPRAIDSPLITTNPAAQQTYFSQSGQSYSLSGQIASNGLPFRVTLAWTDVPGAPLAQGAELVNNLDLQVTIGGVIYKGNVFSQNVSIPGGSFDVVNNMESVFLNPTNMLNGIPVVAAGTPFQITVIANNIAGQAVPNVGEPVPGGSNTLNQDFALVVYNAATNTLSDVPNMATNNDCQTAFEITNFPYAFANTLATNAYSKVFPSPTAGTGGSEEFFRIPLPTAGTVFTVDMAGSALDAELSVWTVQVVPQTLAVRSDCGALTEIASEATTLPGTPQITFTADGVDDYFIVAEGNNGATGPLELNVNRNCASLVMSPGALPSSFPGDTYNEQITVTGGQVPVTFAVSPTNGLPPGLVLDGTTGLISGAATNTGTHTFTITATDALGCTVSIPYTIAIACPSLTLSPPFLPSAPVGQVYSNAITVNGGHPATFSLAVGPLPPGLVLSANGLVSGTPTAIGGSTNRVYTFKVSALNTIGCAGSAFFTISVECPTITLSPTSLPGGTEFVSYSPQTLTASGGTAPYTFSQTGGSLPAGMTLSSNGVLSGTPTSVSSTFTVTATDAFGCSGSASYTLSLIDPAPPVTVTVSPPTLPAGVVGQSYNQMITASSSGNGPYNFAVSGSLPPGLQTNTVGFSFVLSGVPTAAGSFTFTLTASAPGSDPAQANYTINVTSIADLGVSAVLSPRPVTIESNLTCTVTVTNLGPSSATGVTISNTLPAGATLVTDSSGCAANGNTLVCGVGNLAVGASASISYVVQPTELGTISAVASVSAADSTNISTVASGIVNPLYTIATNSKPNVASILDPDGDTVTVSLKGSGALEVRVLGGGNNGPIDQIVLTGTGPSSTLAIQVKKAKGGNGSVNVGGITSDGSLKTISGAAVNVTGAGGIQVGGSLGTVTASALLNSVLSVNGEVGTLQIAEMSNSVCTVSGAIKTVNVGTYNSSKINAEKVGSVKLGTVDTENGNQMFGIQVQNPGGTVSVTHPHLKWKITSLSSTQSNNEFQVTWP
jgi:uncharacterized repeat protein (TIGR01451 family)